VLNVGVHENHFFLSMVLAFLIAAHSPTPALRLAVFAGLSANLNLYVFYGQNGRVAFLEPNSPSDIVNASLALAALNTLFLVLCYIQCVFKDFVEVTYFAVRGSPILALWGAKNLRRRILGLCLRVKSGD